MADPLVATVTARGLRIPIAKLAARLGGKHSYQRFLTALTVTENPQPGRPKVYARAQRVAYRVIAQDPGFLYVPRAKLSRLSGSLLDEIRPDPDLAAGFREVDAWSRQAQPFYEYQTAAANFVCGRGQAYVQMGTGLGKSRFGMAVAAQHRGPVFIVVPTEAIRAQWLEELRYVYPDLEVGAYKNKHPISPATHDAVVGIVNTVRDKEPGFFAGYATVIIDEAHEFASPENLKILWLAQGAPSVLGLSATPDERPDGLDRAVFHFLGPPIYAETDIPGFDVAEIRFRGRVREVEYLGDPTYCETAITVAGTVSAIETVGNVIRDPARLRLVAAEVVRLFRLHATEDRAVLQEFGLGTPTHPAGAVRRHGVFVFAEHREYLPALRDALLERFAPEDVYAPELEPNSEPVVLRGGASSERLGEARRSRIVLTTYGYSRRGISLVDMTSIVLATPRRHGLNQILGRITRRGSDESILRLIVDIKDVRTALKGQSSDRRKVYKAKNYPIFRVRVDYHSSDVAPPTAEETAVWAP